MALRREGVTTAALPVRLGEATPECDVASECDVARESAGARRKGGDRAEPSGRGRRGRLAPGAPPGDGPWSPRPPPYAPGETSWRAPQRPQGPARGQRACRVREKSELRRRAVGRSPPPEGPVRTREPRRLLPPRASQRGSTAFPLVPAFHSRGRTGW